MTDETGKERRHEQNRQDWYEVEVEGQINPGWFDCVDGWEITPLLNGNTLLFGQVVDQPALHGLFARIRDLNLKIISLKKSVSPQSGETRGKKNMNSKSKP
jgi:hypothetical protein